MKSLASTSLIFLFLFRCMSPGIDLACELEKLPNLFEHYAQHDTSGRETFGEFLSEHFFTGENESHEKPGTDHEDLPFHGFHQCCHAPVFCTPDENVTTLVLQVSPIEKPRFIDSLFSSTILDSPFQPPQV